MSNITIGTAEYKVEFITPDYIIKAYFEDDKMMQDYISIATVYLDVRPKAYWRVHNPNHKHTKPMWEEVKKIRLL